MLKIPSQNKDLRRYVFRKDLRKIALYAVWLAIWYFGAYAYNQDTGFIGTLEFEGINKETE